MRLSDVTLLRYGHFDDRRLAFPAPAPGAPDLHLVLGPNEAGKSTFRSAVGDFLFGFEVRTRFAFRFEMSQLAVGATVDTDRGAIPLVRLKKRKDDLRREDGTVADAGLLAAALAGLDRDAFFREQALGHDDLPRGGRDLERYADDLAGQLFSAVTGLSDCIDRQRAIEDTATRLFKADGRAATRWRDARRDFDEAARALKKAETRRSAFERLEREKRQAEEALARLRRERDGAALAKARLERLVRLARPVLQLRTVEAAIEAMSPGGEAPPLLPADAASRVRAAQEAVALARQRAESAVQDAEDRRGALEALAVDEAVLAAAAEIEALAERATVVRNQAEDMVHARAEVEGKRRQAADEARAIGWTADDETLAESLPSRTDRAELRDLEGRREGIAGRVADLAEQAAAIDARLAETDEALVALPAAVDVAPARAALARAREFGDVNRYRAERAATLGDARTRRDDALAALAPWRGEEADLSALVPPEREAFDRADGERRRLEDDIRRLDQSIEERRTRRVALEATLERRRAAGTVPDAEALADARARRDELWRLVRDGARPPAEAAPAYEELVADADGIADARFSAAEEATRIESDRQHAAGLAAEEKELGEQRDARRKALATVLADWNARLATAGLDGLAFEAFPDWLRRRDEALAAARAAREAARALEAFDRAVADAREGLAAALPPGAERPRGDALTDWREAVEAAVAAAEALDARRRELASRRQDDRKAREALSEKIEAAEAALAAHEGRRTRLAGGCGLAADAGPERVRVTLDALDRIGDLLAEAERIERERIAAMDRDGHLFSESAAALAARVAPDLAARAPGEIARTLADRLATARTAAADRTRLQKEIEAANETDEAARRGIAETLAELEPLFGTAGLPDTADLAALAAAAARSDDFRARLAELRAAEETIGADADGHTVSEIAAEVEAGDADERRREIAGIEATLADAERQLEEATRVAVEARAALDAVTGGDASGSPVTGAAADRAVAAGRLAEIAADHLWAFMEARLIRWAIDRYRAENQSPLLARAGDIFSTLTCGRYARLEADPGDGTARLLAVEANSGAGLAVDALSSGTRDQLFLALRLAAADLRNGVGGGGRRVPFIADDLFVNADDARTEAGLSVLADLARRTQIVYLTHHAHLVEIARRTLGDTLNVVEL